MQTNKEKFVMNDDYQELNVSGKVIKIIQSYVSIVNDNVEQK